MASDSCDLVRCHCCRACGRRVVRHKNPKDSGANADAYSDSQTSKTLDEESDTYAITHRFSQTKKSFAYSFANADEQIKAEKGESNSNTRARRKSIRDSIGNASAF
jgi:hypothetical protein